MKWRNLNDMSKLKKYDPERMQILMTALRSVGITVQTPEMMYQIESVLRLARPNATIKDIVAWERIINEQIQATKGENEVAENEPEKAETVDDSQYWGILPDFIYWPENKEYKWFATDFSGNSYFYQNKPEPKEEENIWFDVTDSYIFVWGMGETPNWKNSLTKRPDNE